MRLIVAAALFAATPLFAAVQRNVTPAAAGPNRLDVDVALLSEAASDLRDLRFFDAQKREIGYILVEPKTSEPRWVDGRILPIAATKKTSGFEVDLERAEEIDRLRFAGIAAPFLKRATIEGSGDRARWTLLANATVFDLPDDKLRMLEVPFDAGTYRYLRVTWDDSSSARVTNVDDVSARLHGLGAAPEPLRVELPFQRRASEPGKSRYRISLPGPNLPIVAIELRVANGNVYRGAAISEPRLGNGQVRPSFVGNGTLRRAERWGAVAEEMSIAIERPASRELDLVVDDDNNAPLALTAIVARLAPQPWIYFEAPDASPLTSQYGSNHLDAPRYDLESSRRFLQNAKLPQATWSAASAPAKIAVSEDRAAASLLGAVVDRATFPIARPIPNARAGLTVLLLDADVLARSNELADVRIVDKDARQIPYLVEKRDEPLVLPLKLENVTAAAGTSMYRVNLPYSTLSYGTRIVLRTSSRVFERNIELRAVAEPRRGRKTTTFASAVWRATDPELLPPAITFDPMLRGHEALEIVVHEGDNAPLPIASVELLLPSIALRFHHPGSTLELLYGNAQAGAPRYDVALLAPRMFAQQANELSLGAIAPQAKTDESESGARKFFWIAIGVVAIVLLVLLARLLKPINPVSE